MIICTCVPCLTFIFLIFKKKKIKETQTTFNRFHFENNNFPKKILIIIKCINNVYIGLIYKTIKFIRDGPVNFFSINMTQQGKYCYSSTRPASVKCDFLHIFFVKLMVSSPCSESKIALYNK